MASKGEQRAVEKAGRVFKILKEAAENGERCPTNARLSYLVGYQSGSGPADAVHLLESLGMIRVERGQRTRVVEIVATGKRTKGRVTKPHHTRRG